MMQNIAKLSADEIVRLLELAPHPEGGFYRETYRDPAEGADGRALSTAIYFLLPKGSVSAWHRIDVAEAWHFYAGAPLRISIYAETGESTSQILGSDLAKGERPQCIVPPGAWQMAEALSEDETAPAWSLVGCTVAPGFTFATFELAPFGWQPRYTAF
jgi:predicted cupin superfamily sugar epimerase